MWAIRTLNGPQAGQIINLKEGKNKLGRGSHCEICIPVAGISKEHLEIHVLNDKIILTDLKSSNGTFLNGTQIQTGLLKLGDKISAANILFDLVQIPRSENSIVSHTQPTAKVNVLKPKFPASSTQPSISPSVTPKNKPSPLKKKITSSGSQNRKGEKVVHGMNKYSEYNPNSSIEIERASNLSRSNENDFSSHELFDSRNSFEKFLDQSIMPGIYSLVHLFNYKTILGLFVLLFILIITVLNLLPLNQAASDSIITESRRRALSLARSLSTLNETALKQGDFSRFNILSAQREEGVKDVYVVSAVEASILAPAERLGERPKETEFLSKILGQPKEITSEISPGWIAASVPIMGFDPERQINIPKAHVIVIYENNSISFDNERLFGLFIQMFAIAFVLGFVFYILIYKISEYPIEVLNKNLELAIKERANRIEFNLPYEGIEQLQTNISSLLTRSQNSFNMGNAPIAGGKSKEPEMINMLTLLGGYPALLLDKNFVILKVNSAFESSTGISSINLLHQSIDFMPEQYLKENFKFILSQSAKNIYEIASDQTEIHGRSYTTHCQGFTNSSGEIEYFVITLMPNMGHESGGGVA